MIDVELRSDGSDGERNFTDLIGNAFGGMVSAIIGAEQSKPMTPSSRIQKGNQSSLFAKKSYSEMRETKQQFERRKNMFAEAARRNQKHRAVLKSANATKSFNDTSKNLTQMHFYRGIEHAEGEDGLRVSPFDGPYGDPSPEYLQGVELNRQAKSQLAI